MGDDLIATVIVYDGKFHWAECHCGWVGPPHFIRKPALEDEVAHIEEHHEEGESGG